MLLNQTFDLRLFKGIHTHSSKNLSGMENLRIWKITEPVKEVAQLERSGYLLEVPGHPIHSKTIKFFGTGCSPTKGAAIRLQAILFISNLLSKYVTSISASRSGYSDNQANTNLEPTTHVSILAGSLFEETSTSWSSSRWTCTRRNGRASA